MRPTLPSPSNERLRIGARLRAGCVHVLSGAITVTFENESKALAAGDSLTRPAPQSPAPRRFIIRRFLLPPVYFHLMGEHQEVITELREAGVLAGIRWAYKSAVRRSLESFCEADGHDHAWLGMTRFTLFRDRLDRVFSCERYAVSLDDGTRDVDVLYAELSEHDLTTMPRIAPGHVTRADLYGSAGWTYSDRRFLLAAGEFGRLRTLPWSERSTTKQIVAMQVNPDPHPRQPSLFEDMPADESSPFDALLRAAQRHLDPVTYMVAHSLDATTGDAELLFGRPKLNLRGDPAWHWHEDLLAVAQAGTAGQGQPGPGTGDPGAAGLGAPAEARDGSGLPGAPDPAPAAVPDAAVRLRVVKGERLRDSG